LYAVAAGAAGVSFLALTQSAQAQIIYTSVDAYIPSRYFPTYLDMNHDGIPDFRFENGYRSFPYAAYDFLYVNGLTGGVLALSGGSGFASALAKGAVIGPSGQFGKGSCFMAGTYIFGFDGFSFHSYFGPWTDVENRFLGVSLTVDGQTHYGWIRMSVDTHLVRKVRALITGYAYQSAPNTPIKAGQTSGNSEDDGQTADDDHAATPLQPSVRSRASLGLLAAGAVYRHGEIRLSNMCRSGR
jgi:hypothetical protein